MKNFRNTLLLTAFGLSQLSASAQQDKVYVVSNAHFDSQWNWDVQKSIREYIPKTLDSNLTLFPLYPQLPLQLRGWHQILVDEGVLPLAI